MAIQRLGEGSRSRHVFGGVDASRLLVGSSASDSPIYGIRVGTFTLNTSAIGQFASSIDTFTLSGASTGDIVLVFPSTALDTGITLQAAANVTATSTVQVTFINHSSASVTQTSGLTNRYIHFKLSS